MKDMRDMFSIRLNELGTGIDYEDGVEQYMEPYYYGMYWFLVFIDVE